MDIYALNAARDVLPAARDLVRSVDEKISSPQAQASLDSILAFLRDGFSQVNVVEGLIIALVATLLMHSWRRWLATAFLATFANIVIDLMIPVFAGSAALRLPAVMEASFWRLSAALLVGYWIVIGIFFAAKRLLTGSQLQAAHG